ncbi:hypothetical protein FA95DRAFT_1220895 [Auriscalpium vulgare]|uniref:Uncharacterized protein n=1 Tax=Auriscalpium vulgare TaxID=40419 RepID=A0ACB8R2T5_9AGAM|nr:hypothetical protein FA95DRAFT_1220895 [Auriscalpium vulgare]
MVSTSVFSRSSRSKNPRALLSSIRPQDIDRGHSLWQTHAYHQNCRAPTPTLCHLLRLPRGSFAFAGAILLAASSARQSLNGTYTKDTGVSPGSAVDPLESAGLHPCMSPESPPFSGNLAMLALSRRRDPDLGSAVSLEYNESYQRRMRARPRTADNLGVAPRTYFAPRTSILAHAACETRRFRQPTTRRLAPKRHPRRAPPPSARALAVEHQRLLDAVQT